MFELTIAQGIIVIAAIILATIIIAQPFRRKVNFMTLESSEIETLAKSFLRQLNEDRLAEYILDGMAMLIANNSTNSIVAFPRKDMTLDEQKESVGIVTVKTGTDSTLKIKIRKSRAGEIRKPSTLPANATAEEKRKLKTRLRSRAYRAKKRAEAVK